MSENRCVCCGAVIPEGRQVCERCEVGTDNNVGSKTADEMFRELGYLWENTPVEGGKGYEDEDSNKIEVDGYHVTFTPEGGGMALTVGAKTILACAQLIREMGCIE